MAGSIERHTVSGQDSGTFPLGVAATFPTGNDGISPDETTAISLRDRILNLPPDFGRREVVLVQTLYQLNEDGSGFAHPTWDDIYHAAYSDITADYTPQDVKIAKHSARLKWQKVVSKLAAVLAVPREKRPGHIGRITAFIDAQRDISVYAGLSDEDFLRVASRDITFGELLLAGNGIETVTLGDGVTSAGVLRKEVLGKLKTSDVKGVDENVTTDIDVAQAYIAMVDASEGMVIEIDEAEALTSAFTHNRDVFKQFNQPDVPEELIEAIRVEIEYVNPPISTKQIRERERDAVNRFWNILRKDNNDFPTMYGLQSDTIRQVLDYFIGNRGRELLMEALYNKLMADTEETDNSGSGFDGGVRVLRGRGSKRTHMQGAWSPRD